MSKKSNRINETFDENGNPVYVVKTRHGDKIVRSTTKKDMIVLAIMVILALFTVGFMTLTSFDPKIKLLVFVPAMVILVIYINRRSGLK